MSTPKVMVDATPLSGVASGSGIGTYTRNMLNALAGRDDVEVAAIVDSDVRLPAGVSAMRLQRMSQVSPEWVLGAGRAFRRPRAALIEHTLRLPVDLRLHRKAGWVFHNPGFHAMTGIRHPWVQTLHDVIPLVFDADDQAVLKKRWERFGPRYKRADAVIAISKHAAEEGTRLLGIDPDRVYVAPHGVDPAYTTGAPPEPADPPYVLLVAEYSRRKGFAEAFEMMDRLVEAGYPHDLVVAGRVHDWGTEELDRLHKSTAHPDRIHIRGFVEDLPGLYRGASCFVMPSRYEGFGLPCLEAMASGVPVVSFSNSALTEVVEGGGLLVRDGDVGELTAAVRAILDNPSTAAMWAERGLRHARLFNWERSAEVHVDAYRAAAKASDQGAPLR